VTLPLLSSTRLMLDLIWRYRVILRATTKVELRKRFAGSVLGIFWAVLNPLLFLCVYLFLNVFVFMVAMPGLSRLGVIIFIFSGLVPFLGLMEAATAGTVCVKQNMHLIKNVIVPIDLVPVRTVVLSMVGVGVGLALTLLLLIIDKSLSPYLWLLPAVVLLQFLAMVGLAWVLASLGIIFPDLAQIINVVMITLMFVSPIGFRPTALPEGIRAIVWLNPVHYMIDSYRSVLMQGFGPDWWSLAIFAALSLVTFWLGAAFFRRFKGVLVDYE
jgi:lipopolysaccharide transport system permease protein